jgi:hypothetical protein
MGDLSETVWQRGRSDAIKWLGSLRLRFALIFVPAVAAFVANRAGLKGEDVVLITAATAALSLASVLLVAVISAPVRQRNEARDELRAIQATRDGRRAQLTEFLRQGRKLYKQRPDDVREWWKTTVKPWIVETSNFLEAHYGKAESEMFLSPSPPSAADIEGSVNPEHNRRRLNLNAQMEVLRRLLERFPV